MSQKLTSFTNFVFKWGAIMVLAVLAVAGGVHILAPVDPIISYSVVVIFVGLLFDKALALSKK